MSRPPVMRKKPSGVRSPVKNALVARVDVGREELRAVGVGARDERPSGTSSTSAARRAATSVRMNWLVGTSTLPPRWPHFFSDASWSSKCTPAAPASIIAFISSNALSGPPKPASASATIGASQWRSRRPSACSIWSARSERLVDPAHDGAGRGRPG